MKRIAALFMVLLLVLSFAGCSESQKDTKKNNEKDTTTLNTESDDNLNLYVNISDLADFTFNPDMMVKPIVGFFENIEYGEVVYTSDLDVPISNESVPAGTINNNVYHSDFSGLTITFGEDMVVGNGIELMMKAGGYTDLKDLYIGQTEYDKTLETCYDALNNGDLKPFIEFVYFCVNGVVTEYAMGQEDSNGFIEIGYSNAKAADNNGMTMEDFLKKYALMFTTYENFTESTVTLGGNEYYCLTYDHFQDISGWLICRRIGDVYVVVCVVAPDEEMQDYIAMIE